MGFLKLAWKTVLLLRMGGSDVPMGRQRPLTYVCRGVFQIWWKYWHGIVAFRKDIRTIWTQRSHSDVVEDASRVARHAVFLGEYLTVSGIALPPSSGSWHWRRRPCDFSEHWKMLTLVPGTPFSPVILAHYQVSGRCVGLTTLPPSCADCLEIGEPQPPGTLRACPGL